MSLALEDLVIERLWIYQLNPRRGRFEGGLPTSTENLLAQIDEPATWYVTKNYLQAKVGDDVLVKVSEGRKGDACGIVAMAVISAIDLDNKEVTLDFFPEVTRALAADPIPLELLRERIPKDQNNLVNVYPHAVWLRDEVLKRYKLPVDVVPFERSRTRFQVSNFLTNSQEEMEATLHKDSRTFACAIEALALALEVEGFDDLQEQPLGVDLSAWKGDDHYLFEIWLDTDEEDYALRPEWYLLRLHEARVRLGNPSARLVLVTPFEITEEYKAILESMNIEHRFLEVESAEEETTEDSHESADADNREIDDSGPDESQSEDDEEESTPPPMRKGTFQPTEFGASIDTCNFKSWHMDPAVERLDEAAMSAVWVNLKKHLASGKLLATPQDVAKALGWREREGERMKVAEGILRGLSMASYIVWHPFERKPDQLDLSASGLIEYIRDAVAQYRGGNREYVSALSHLEGMDNYVLIEAYGDFDAGVRRSLMYFIGNYTSLRFRRDNYTGEVRDLEKLDSETLRTVRDAVAQVFSQTNSTATAARARVDELARGRQRVGS